MEEVLGISEHQNINSKEVYTYIAIPIDALKTSSEDSQAFTIPPNFLLQGLTNHSTVVPLTLNQDILATLSQNNVQSDDNSQGKVFNILPKVGEDFLQNTLQKSLSNKYDQNSITPQSQISNMEDNNLQNAIFKEPNEFSVTNKLPTIICKTGVIKCTMCNSVFNKRSIWKKHMAKHLETKKFKCEHCSAIYNLEYNLKLHMAIHRKGQLFCPVCNRRFMRLAGLKSHLINHQKEETFTCKDCFSEFEDETDLLLHMETHKEVQNEDFEEFPLKCPICTHTFDNLEQRKEHIVHHSNMKHLVPKRRKSKKYSNKANIRKHICYVCKKSFFKYCFLERHMRIHTGEKPYACHLCKSAFNQKGTLKVHLLRHSGLKPFKCILCPAKFSQNCNLRAHIQKTHTVSGPNDTVYKCTLCSCTFKRVSSLSSHITKMHVSESSSHCIFSEVMEQLKDLQNQLGVGNTDKGGLKDNKKIVGDSNNFSSTTRNVHLADTTSKESIQVYSVKQRKVGQNVWYTCSFCSKEFKKPSDLVRHIRIHTKEKPFKCEHCGQCFTLKSTLSNHLSTHYRSKTFECVICSKTFTTLKILTFHMKKHEKIIIKTGGRYTCKICNLVIESVHEVKSHIADHNTSNRLQRVNVPNKPAGIEVIMQQPLIETPEGLFSVPTPKPANSYSEEELLKRKYKCNQCKAAFLKQIHLKRHLLIHSQDRKYRCESCPKSFYSSYALKEHMKFHSGLRNYECIECGKKFVTTGILKRHMIVHTSFKPYVCPYCKMRFKTESLCRKHINVHKKDINLEVHALNETGEIDDLFNNQLEIHESLPNEAFVLNTEQTQLQTLTLESVSANMGLSSDMNMVMPSAKVLFTDENGIIVSTSLDQEIGATDQDFLQLTNPSGYTTSDFLLRDDLNEKEVESLADTHPFMENGVADNYPTIYINYGDLPSLSTSSLYNPNFNQKITDPIFLNGDTSNADNIFSASSTITETYLNTNEEDNVPLPYTISLQLSKNGTIDNSYPILDSGESTDTLATSKINQIENQSVIVESPNILNSNEKDTEDSVAEANEYIRGEETNELNSTKSNVETQDTSYACTQCQQSFDTMKELALHSCEDDQVTNGIEEPEIVSASKYKCDICNVIFKNQSNYKKHMPFHKRKLSMDKTCSYCNRTFKKRCDLIRHIRIHTGEKPFKCEKCEKSFSLKSTLDCHYRTHNPSSKKEFPCLVCGANFSFSSSLKVHSTIHTGAKPYKCSMCPETFRTSGNRKTHMAVHTKSDELKKPFRSKKAKINNILASIVMDDQNVNHSQEIEEISENIGLQLSTIHEAPLQLVTEIVDKDVIISIPNQPEGESESLLLHLDNVLLETGIEELAVQEDLDNTTRNEILEEIVNIDTEISMTETSKESGRASKSVSKNFECDICHKMYSRKYVLTKHKKTHELKCTSCDVYFDNLETYETHKKIHNKCRPFSCHLCANTFNLEMNLKTHLKRIHDVVII